MHLPAVSATAALSLSVASARSSLYVDNAPTYVRPYVIERYASAQAVKVGNQIYRFPVTGPSSGGAFSLIDTSAPGSDALGVLPHVHLAHHENFFCAKGRFQLWTEKDGDEEARMMSAGDYGAVPHNTTHTFQILEPDTQMTGVIQPGGFEDLFYFLADSNYTSSTHSPYIPGASDALSAGGSASIISKLESYDVYAQLEYNPRRDLVNGSAPANSTWHSGKNVAPQDTTTPFYIAKDYGSKYLNTQYGYQIISPFITPVQSAGNFTEGTITIDRQLSNITVPTHNLPGHVAFQVLEGALSVNLAKQNIQLLQGDVVFVPGNTTFQYWSDVAFTKFLYICAGAKGIDVELTKNATAWAYPVFPTYAGYKA